MPDAPVDPQCTPLDIGGDIHLPWKSSILDTIRERPAMYLGEGTITALWHFLIGWEMALTRLGNVQKSPEVPIDFADWVGYRLHLGSNFDGFWKRAILSRVRDESHALDRFFELRDEYLRRNPRVVATIRKDRREYQRQRQVTAAGPFVDFVELLPESLSILVYTDDPGFFLSADESAGRLYNGWFYPALAALSWQPWSPSDRFEVQDREAWDRLFAEDKRYRRNLNRTRARIERRERDARDAGKPEA